MVGNSLKTVMVDEDVDADDLKGTVAFKTLLVGAFLLIMVTLIYPLLYNLLPFSLLELYTHTHTHTHAV